MADGYDEFLRFLESLPSKEEKKEVANARPSVAKDAEAKAEKQNVRPTVKRGTSVKFAAIKQDTKEVDVDAKTDKPNVRPTVNRGSSVKRQLKPQAEPEEELKSKEGSWMDDKYGFVHLTDANYEDAFTEVSTEEKLTLTESEDGSSMFGSLTVFLIKIAVKMTVMLATAFIQILWVFLLVLLAWIFANLYHGMRDLLVWQMNDPCVLACSEIIHQVKKLDACLSSC